MIAMKLLYDLYQLCIALPLLLLLTILTALTTTIGSLLGGARFWGYYPAKIWSRLVCYLLFLPVHVEGREKLHRHTSYVFVPNHQGAFDIFLVYGFLNRNFKWMMKKSLRKIPLVGKACESAGHIFVDRSGPHAAQATIRQAESVLVNGVSLVVFPEGARTYTGRMGSFKRGAFQLADDLQLPVVPVTIDGFFPGKDESVPARVKESPLMVVPLVVLGLAALAMGIGGGWLADAMAAIAAGLA